MKFISGIIGLFFCLNFFLISDDEIKIKPGTELLVDVSFLPEFLAEFRGEKLSAKEFLPTIAPKLNLLAREKFTSNELKQLIVLLIREKYEHLVALELAADVGVEPNEGLAFLELQNFEKEFGKKALTEKLEKLGVSYQAAPRFMAEAAAIDAWYTSKILPANEANEAEALLYYSENKEKFNMSERVKLAHISVTFAEESDKIKAREKISRALHELSLGKDFSDVARQFSENNLAQEGGVDDKFYTENEMPTAMKELMKLSKGEISSVIEANGAFHIFKIVDKRGEGLVKFSEIKKGLVLALSLEKGKQAMRKAIESRLKEAKFKLNFE